MKKINILIIASLVLLCSCGKMLDEIAPKGAITTDKLKDSDIALLNNGVMHQFEAVVSNLWFEGDYLAENYASGPGFTFTDTHAETQSASSSTALSRWGRWRSRLKMQLSTLPMAAIAPCCVRSMSRFTRTGCR